MKQRELDGQDGVHVPDFHVETDRYEEPPFRSQSVRSSDEAE
jgi:hypothetical protein